MEKTKLNTEETPKEFHKTKLTIGTKGQKALEVLQQLKVWLKLNEVLKQYKTSYKEIIRLVAINILQVTIIEDEVWFFRGNLEIHLKQKKENKNIDNDYNKGFKDAMLKYRTDL